jgi:hypothetical protein
MNKKDQQLIADMIAQSIKAIITAKKPETETKTTKKEKNASPPEKQIPPHKKSDIPQLLNAMTVKESQELFGDILKVDTPYKMHISPFYAKYNIQLGENKFDKKNLTYEQKHSIIVKQLSDVSKKTFTAQKQRHLKHLKDKIASPPETDMWGNPMTDKKLESIASNLQKEIERWNDGKTE